ncbi:MAG: hypothetical protein QM710_08110 [Flavobacterium sp.]
MELAPKVGGAWNAEVAKIIAVNMVLGEMKVVFDTGFAEFIRFKEKIAK